MSSSGWIAGASGMVAARSHSQRAAASLDANSFVGVRPSRASPAAIMRVLAATKPLPVITWATATSAGEGLRASSSAAPRTSGDMRVCCEGSTASVTKPRGCRSATRCW